MATNARITATDTPRRAPRQITIGLTTTGKDLGGADGNPLRSVDGFKCQCGAAWLWGDADGQLHTVAADEVEYIESSSLSGWFAKSASGTPNLVITALIDVAEVS